MRNNRSLVLGLCFIAGMAVFAILVGSSLRAVKRMDEFVTVRGLSEREVPADLAIWPVTFMVNANDLSHLQDQIQQGRTVVHRFLAESGFAPGELSNAPPHIIDAQAADTGSNVVRAFRYQANVTVLLRSAKVAQVKAALETCDRLVRQGIALSGGNYESKPQFLFTGLRKIKPEMIQEANRDARKAAERFASDSRSRLGEIRHALQGQFEIDDVDPSSPDRKNVRVVTTVDFYLR